MKKLLFLLVLGVVITFSHPRQTQAQWYKSYGVTSINELTKDQCATALGNVKKSKSETIGIFAGGGMLLLLGSIVPVRSGWNNIVPGIVKGMSIYAGGCLIVCGVLSLVNSSIREARIKKVLTRFPVQVSLSPHFSEYLHHYNVGLSMAVLF